MIGYIFYANFGAMSVSVLIFISGAMLEYTHSKIESISDYVDFIWNRIARIYPAYWMALLIGLLYAPALIYQNPLSIIIQFTGFQAFFGMWGGNIDDVGWFVGLIICLYLMHPLISRSLKSHLNDLWMDIYLFLTFGSRFIIVTNPAIFASFNLMERWLPLCNLFAFALGILVVQKKWYPKFSLEDGLLLRTIVYISGLSFYVFLIHNIFIRNSIGNLWAYFVVVISISMAIMWLDQQVQSLIRSFLKTANARDGIRTQEPLRD